MTKRKKLTRSDKARIRAAVNRGIAKLKAAAADMTIGDALKVPAEVREAYKEFTIGGFKMDWDDEFDALKNPVLNPVIAFHQAIDSQESGKALPSDHPYSGKKVEVEEATVFEAHFDERGKMVRDQQILEAINHGWPAPHLLRRVISHSDYVAAVRRAEAAHEAQPKRSQVVREAQALQMAARMKLMREGFFTDDFGWTSFGGANTAMDPNQYTEFAPTMAGPFYKQLYMFDYLRQHAYAFEAWNHNPLAKRIVSILAQYTLGRRFSLRIKNEDQQAAWDAFDAKYKITDKVSEFWCKEPLIYGETFIDMDTWQAVDPSTIWDIITNPDDISDQYYAYQSYPTAFQQFTGYTVDGVPGAEKVPAQKYIVRQRPMSKLIHIKINCVSNEKRGRSILFPILGWLKRVKDLYNAMVIRQWLLSSFVWDVSIDGNQADVDAYATAYAQIPNPGSMHVHNKTIERKPMPAIETAGRGSGGESLAENLLAFIATAVGLPKEFLNIISMGGGSRAQALTSAEPFTKAIEDYQSKWESVLQKIAKIAIIRAGLDYKPGDVEVLFPSVTKDTTSETIKNLQVMETMGWLSKRTAGEMAAKEVNITQYDFEDEQQKIKDDDSAGLNMTGGVPPPPGRFGGAPAVPAIQPEEPDLSEIHGQGKVDLADNLKTL